MADTYDRGIQLRASRRRYEDALALHNAKRWNGAIYMGGYAIECSLTSLICYNEMKNNFTKTKSFKGGMRGAAIHDLEKMLENADLAALLNKVDLKKVKILDRTGSLAKACKTVVELWKKDELRYGDKVGNKSDSERFMAAVKELHLFLLRQQEETL